ncbi:MAG: hypothetical protein IT184_17500 [Acidobacteria bacterium]|nr:hypothetical protein [Acidobacteriota bacterium]
MSLALFVPSRDRKRGPAQRRAVPIAFPPRQLAATVPAVTAHRTRRVGSPAGLSSTPRLASDPVFYETAVAGLEALAVLERRGRDVAHDLRWRHAASARTGLLELIHGVQALVALATTAADARGDDFDLLNESEGYAAGELTRRAVHELIARQATDDWTALADVLERALLPALRAWRAVFEAFLDPQCDPDPGGWAA